jgi:glycosyltransferase involved in cell wall biosynthesis
VSSAVPLIRGGGRFIVDWLAEELRKRGHQAEVIYIPTVDDPETLLGQMAALRAMEFGDAFDRVITFRPPSHVISHPNKVCWFIHHVRVFYDLWDVPEYRPVPDNAHFRAFRATLMQADTTALKEARLLFSNSRVVADRVARFNGLQAQVLYPPVFQPERFRSGDYGDEIVCVCRIEHHKRQHLLIEALGLTRTPVRLRLCGASSSEAYVADLHDTARRLGVEDRVVIEHRWIEEEEKVQALETALASAYVPLDEDSYGYPTLEAGHAGRCTISVSDSGGVPEFVQDGINGFITAPDPAALAAVFDRLHEDRALAARLGEAARQRISDLGVDWDTVVSRLLA